MRDFLLAVEVVFPLIVMIFIGYLIKILDMIEESTFEDLNKLVFRVFMSTLLFLNIYRLNYEEAFNSKNLKIIVFLYMILIGVFLIAIKIMPKFVKDKKKCSVLVQGLVRGNSILFGIPITASLYGDNETGLISLLAACIIPLSNMLGVFILEVNRKKKIRFLDLVLGIIKNPAILASIIASVFLILSIKLPEIIVKPLDSISKVTIPLALIVLGGTIEFKKLTYNLKYLINFLIIRLLIIPAISFYIFYKLDILNKEMVAVLGIIASPLPIASFTMAKELEADSEMAGQLVLSSTIVSMFTIFAWIFILKSIKII